MARLGNFIEQIRGVSYKPEDVCSANDSDAIAILRANNIQDDGLNFDDLVFVKKSKVSNTQLLRKGDIVVCASSGSKNLVGKAAIAKENMEMSFGAFCKVVRVKAITAEYLGHYFQSPAYRNLISDLASGANINNIRNEHIDELDLPVPEKEIQEEISVQLDKICDLILNRKEQLEKLDLLVKSRFVELFGEVETNEKGFTMRKMDECCKFVGGAQPDKSHFEYEKTEDNIRLIQIRDYKTDRYITYIPKSLARKTCTASDIMIGRYGPPIFQILSGIEGAYNVALMKAIPTEEFNVEYFRCFLKDEKLLHYLESFSQRTAGQDGIQIDKLNAYPCFVPPMELQNQFAEFVEQTDKLKFEVKEALEKLETLKKSLMQKYFG